MKRNLTLLTGSNIQLVAGALAAILTTTAVQAATSTLATDPTTGHQYQADYTARNYSGAKADCESKGAHLAVITSESEFSFIFDAVISQSASTPYMIGHRYPANATQPITVTGESYYPLQAVREYISQNDSVPDTMQYQYFPYPMPNFGFYWEENITSPYICEWQ